MKISAQDHEREKERMYYLATALNWSCLNVTILEVMHLGSSIKEKLG